MFDHLSHCSAITSHMMVSRRAEGIAFDWQVVIHI